MLFNAFFWIAFEQAGSSINVFTEQKTDRSIALPEWFREAFSSQAWTSSIVFILIGFVGTVGSILGVISRNRAGAYKSASACVFAAILSIGILAVGVLKPVGYMQWLATFNEIPATWFQSVNAGLIFILAPIFAGIWTFLGNRRMDPSQPVKIALGLIFLGLGYIFMVWAGQIAVGGAAKAGMFLIFMTYLWHTVGELCLSPTGLSYVTKAAPVRFVSLLMGIWFISSFIANLGGGLVAAQVEAIEKGTLKLPWSFGGQADFFFLFVVTSIGAGIVILIFSPLLKKLTGGRG
jgi:proton-dependent oligopeptide transporter, POT family